jgi:hypothetical protein
MFEPRTATLGGDASPASFPVPTAIWSTVEIGPVRFDGTAAWETSDAREVMRAVECFEWSFGHQSMSPPRAGRWRCSHYRDIRTGTPGDVFVATRVGLPRAVVASTAADLARLILCCEPVPADRV